MSSLIDPTAITLERIVDRANLSRAHKSVVSNKGAAGVDGMQYFELLILMF